MVNERCVNCHTKCGHSKYIRTRSIKVTNFLEKYLESGIVKKIGQTLVEYQVNDDYAVYLTFINLQ